MGDRIQLKILPSQLKVDDWDFTMEIFTKYLENF